jgi:hypothetical protein
MLWTDPPVHTSGVEDPAPKGCGMLTRVSTRRQGVIATKTPSVAPPGICSCGFGACHDNGARQSFNGAGSAACAQAVAVGQTNASNDNDKVQGFCIDEVLSRVAIG